MNKETTYRGFGIRFTLTGQCFIEKGGSLIGWAKDAEQARRIIDELLGGAR